MSRYYRILEKAKLDRELFGSDSTPTEIAEFPPVVTPERELAPLVGTSSTAVVDEEFSTAMEPESAVAIAEQEVAIPAETTADDWRFELGQMLGLDTIPAEARLGMCPLGSLKSAAESAAALGQWIAARSSSPVLIVEACFDAPQLARLFRTRRLGLAEAMAAREPRWDHFVHDTLYPGLKVMPAGRNPGLRQFLVEQDAFCRTLDSLSRSFENVIVMLPNPRVGGFDRLAVSRAADVIFPVFQPGKLTASQASRAIGKLAISSARVGAALVAPQHVFGEAARMEHIAKQLGDSLRGDYA